MHNLPGEQVTCGFGALSVQDLGEKKANMVSVRQNEGALGGGQRVLYPVMPMPDQMPDKQPHGKKAALLLALKQARREWLS